MILLTLLSNHRGPYRSIFAQRTSQQARPKKTLERVKSRHHCVQHPVGRNSIPKRVYYSLLLPHWEGMGRVQVMRASSEREVQVVNTPARQSHRSIGLWLRKSLRAINAIAIGGYWYVFHGFGISSFDPFL